LLQSFVEAVTHSRLNLKMKLQNYTGQLYNTHHLSVAFSFTIGLNNKKKQQLY